MSVSGNRFAGVALATLLLVTNLAAQDKPSARTLPPGESLVVEGLPAIPYSLVDEVRRYTESRAATFYSWHPKQRSLLIGTRSATRLKSTW